MLEKLNETAWTTGPGGGAGSLFLVLRAWCFVRPWSWVRGRSKVQCPWSHSQQDVRDVERVGGAERSRRRGGVVVLGPSCLVLRPSLVLGPRSVQGPVSVVPLPAGC